MDAIVPAHAIAIDLAAEGKHAARFSVKDDVAAFNGAFHAAGLVWPLEMPGELRTILLKLYIFGGGFAVVVVRIDGPVAGDVRRGLVGRRLLRPQRSDGERQQND